MSKEILELQFSAETSLDSNQDNLGLPKDFKTQYTEKEWRRIKKLKKR
jgi:hypothetical protein